MLIASCVSWVFSVDLCNIGGKRFIANGLSLPSRIASTLSSVGSSVVGRGGKMPVSFQTSVISVASVGRLVSGVLVHIHTLSLLSHNETSVLPFSVSWCFQ